MATVLPLGDWLSGYDRDTLRDDISSILADAEFNCVSITYSRFNVSGGGTSTYEPTTGTVTTAHTNSTITALVGPVTEKDSSLLNRGIGITDLKFLIDRADLAADPTQDDLIVYGSNTYNIRIITTCPVSQLVLVYASIHGGR